MLRQLDRFASPHLFRDAVLTSRYGAHLDDASLSVFREREIHVFVNEEEVIVASWIQL